jgi:D-arabinose 1-dehydrogenase-like Zn-dependent alcohol dehydrogenase
MKAMVLNELWSLEENKTPLEFTDLPDPVPGGKEILVQVSACGVCHTELDEIEGRTPPPHLPVVLGHQVVGLEVERVVSKLETGSASRGFTRPVESASSAWRETRTCARISRRRAGMPTAGTRSI